MDGSGAAASRASRGRAGWLGIFCVDSVAVSWMVSCAAMGDEYCNVCLGDRVGVGVVWTCVSGMVLVGGSVWRVRGKGLSLSRCGVVVL